MRWGWRLWWVFVVLGLGCAAGSVPSASTVTSSVVAVPTRFTVHEVAPDTWVFNEAQPWQSNVLVARMPDRSLVLVNAPATEAATRELLDYLDARHGARRLTVINSHHHIDSVGGNALLLERGAEVFASTATVLLTTRDTAAQRDGAVESGLVPPESAAEFQATRIAAAPRTFDPAAGLTLRFGDEVVRVIFPGAAHSSDNVVVHLPARATLFGGCMVRAADSLGPLDHVDLGAWSRAITTLQALAPTIVIPGHGIRYDAAQLDNTQRLLAQPQ